MALTKAGTSHVTGQTASTTTTATDTSDAYRASIGVEIVQVGTPTTAATFKVQVSYDGGTTYHDLTGTVSYGLAAGTYSWSVELPDAANRVRLVYTAQAGGTSSTLSATVGEMTGV